MTKLKANREMTKSKADREMMKLKDGVYYPISGGNA